METYKKYKDDYILFLESGFIAVNQADEDAAVKLFRAAELLRPDIVLPQVGMGYLYLHKLEIKKAISYFEKALKKEPQNETAKTLLGICLTMTPKEVLKGEKILAETIKSDDKGIKKLSDTALDFVDRFVKREPSPFEIRKKK